MQDDERPFTAVVSVRVGDLLCPLTIQSTATPKHIVETLAFKLRRDLQNYGLFQETSGRRTTVSLQQLDPSKSVAQLGLGKSGIVLTLCSLGEQKRARIIFTFLDAAVELPVSTDMSCGEFLTTALGTLGKEVPAGSQSLLIVKYAFPPPESGSQIRSDDWEVLSDSRSVDPFHTGSGYRLLCCRTEEWETSTGEPAPVRAWLTLIMDWGRQKKGVKKVLRIGLPAWGRGMVWSLLLDSYSRANESPGLYSSLVTEEPGDAAMGLSERWESDRRVIFRDVYRTFPTHSFFAEQNASGQLALQNVLVAWHSMEPDVGYCQGINFLAAVLLLHLDEEAAFWSLHSLLKLRGLENMYRSGMPLLHASMTTFQNLVERLLPQIASYFAVNDIYISSFASPWFHTLFAWRFPLPLVVRIFDIVFREGLAIVFRLGLALLKNQQAAILALDPSEALIMLQDVDWLLAGLSVDECISLALRVKKTKDMNQTGINQTDPRSSMQSSSLLPVSLGKPLLQFKKMQSNLKLLTSKTMVAFEGPETCWTQPDEGVLLLDSDGAVAAGTPEKLVERLTGVHFPGQEFTEAFLLTFRSFLSPLDLARLLNSRLAEIPRPVSMSANDFDQTIVAPIHLRVFNVLRLWLVSFPRDFDQPNVMQAVERIVQLLQDLSMADRLRRTLVARPQPQRPGNPASPRKSGVSGMGIPLVKSWSASEFAKHLTGRDFELYRLVQAHHLLDASLTTHAVISWNKKLQLWIEFRILESGNRERCLEQIDFFLDVASANLALNNISGACVVVLALRRVSKQFQTIKILSKLQQSRKWAFLCDIVDMEFGRGLETFFDRFRDQATIPWIEPFISATATISREQEMVTVSAVNFVKRVQLLRVVQLYTQFQKKTILVEPGSKTLFNCVWGWHEVPQDDLQALVGRISESKWVKGGERASSPRAASSGIGGGQDSPARLPKLGRRKSNVTELSNDK